jgi:threonine synthase
MEATVFMPLDTPAVNVAECENYGAETYLVNGWIHDAGAAAARYQEEHKHYFNVGTLREPGRVEGKKTMGFEIAEQSDWVLPNAIVYPTGGGSGLIGMWKAFRELLQLGIAKGEMPRFYCVQEEGCDPVVQAFRSQQSAYRFLPDPSFHHTGIRVPYPPDTQLLLDIVRSTGGSAVDVSPSEVQAARQLLQTTDIPASPEAIAGLAGLIKLYEQREFGAGDDIVLFNTAHRNKY